MKKTFTAVVLVKLISTIGSIAFVVLMMALVMHFTGMSSPFNTSSQKEVEQAIEDGKAELAERQKTVASEYEATKEKVEEKSSALEEDIDAKFAAHQSGEAQAEYSSSIPSTDYGQWMENSMDTLQGIIHGD